MLPLRPHRWRLCDRQGCKDANLLFGPGNPFWARKWLESFKDNAFAMDTLRVLLSQHSSAPLSRMSDEALVNNVAELLAAGRFHVHAEPLRAVVGLGSAVREPVELVAFPLSQRAPRKAVPLTDLPPLAPPTFTDIDARAQAATLVAAAAEGTPFCPL
jgi:hypothetical protein